MNILLHLLYLIIYIILMTWVTGKLRKQEDSCRMSIYDWKWKRKHITLAGYHRSVVERYKYDKSTKEYEVLYKRYCFKRMEN